LGYCLVSGCTGPDLYHFDSETDQIVYTYYGIKNHLQAMHKGWLCLKATLIFTSLDTMQS